ncbi:hypothetical protein MHU86_21541 [Fragilaria crotonensis]|nr:hypothetical protein MHU86_21541 [Fragilaria crotonensis]
MTTFSSTSRSSPSSSDATLRPFEWLTSSQSVLPIIESLNLSKKIALHLGCGSSTLGETMVNELDFEYVLNIDKDSETLDRMRRRWEERNKTTMSSSSSASSNQQEQEQQSHHQQQRLEYQVVDFACSPPGVDEMPHSPYPLIVEKSTLDCTLCSTDASTGLLSLVYQHLAVGGYYVLISFNSLELLLPLLRDLPGANWTVSHYEMARQVEDLNGCYINTNNSESASLSCVSIESQVPDTDLSTRSLRVIICQKNESTQTMGISSSSSSSSVPHSTDRDVLDWDAVQHHIVTTNNIWYRTLHPLLTETRQREIEGLFGDKSSLRSLLECYHILFSDAERQDLTYDYFLEDWHAYQESHPNIPATEMNLTTALNFLKEMQ